MSLQFDFEINDLILCTLKKCVALCFNNATNSECLIVTCNDDDDCKHNVLTYTIESVQWKFDDGIARFNRHDDFYRCFTNVSKKQIVLNLLANGYRDAFTHGLLNDLKEWDGSCTQLIDYYEDSFSEIINVENQVFYKWDHFSSITYLHESIMNDWNIIIEEIKTNNNDGMQRQEY